MKTLVACILLMLISAGVVAQRPVMSFEEYERLNKNDPWPIIILLSASWCKYCQAMKQTFLRNPEITQKSHVLFLDGETQKNIRFAGRDFRPSATGTHELASELGEIDGRVSYPTLVVLNSKYEIVYQKAGFHSPEAIRSVALQVMSAKY